MYFHHFRHLGRHLEFLKTLNDDRLSSSRILNGNVLPTIIHHKKNFIPDFQVHLKYAIFVPDYFGNKTESINKDTNTVPTTVFAGHCCDLSICVTLAYANSYFSFSFFFFFFFFLLLLLLLLLFIYLFIFYISVLQQALIYTRQSIKHRCHI